MIFNASPSTAILAFLAITSACFTPSANAAPVTADSLVRRARELGLARSLEWRRLVHYETGAFGGTESLADDPRFFVDPGGKTDPDAELEATLRGFLAPVTPAHLEREKIVIIDHPTRELMEAEQRLPQHPVCQFPARLAYLRSALGWNGDGLPAIECNRFRQFKRRLSADGVSLVFSSFFLGSPSSTFGHTLLRFHNSALGPGATNAAGNRSELLDTGVNYAANPTVTNPLLYSVFGLAGLFPGTFTAVPYYYKVREYNDQEARDLWSYRLDLTPAEIERLVEHLWEEGSTNYDYFYFTENCATQMLNLLDAAAPRLHLRDRVPYYVIPSATVHTLFEEKGFVLERTYRPSVRREFFHRHSRLAPDESRAFDRLLEHADPTAAVADLPQAGAAAVLDTWSDYIEFKLSDRVRREDPEALALKQRALLARSRIRIKSAPLAMPAPENEAPENAHGVRRLQVGAGYSDRRKGFTTVDWRFAMHDALDGSRGYPTNTTVEFFTARANLYWDRPSFELEDLRIFQIQSLTPINRFETPTSYAADFRYHRRFDRDFGTESAHAGRGGYAEFKFGTGTTIALAKPSETEGRLFSAGVLGFLALQYSPQFVASNARVAASPRAFALFNFSHDVKWLAQFEPEWRLFSANPYYWEASTSIRGTLGKKWSVGATATRTREEERGYFAVQTLF